MEIPPIIRIIYIMNYMLYKICNRHGHRLWLGGEKDAEEAKDAQLDAVFIDVRGHVDFFENDRDKFENLVAGQAIAMCIEACLHQSDVVVHCTAGIERSPLAIAIYLVEYAEVTIEAAYMLIIDIKGDVRDCSFLLPATFG